jgi:O-6-methylguanine DNA methyltransferase
MILHKAMCSFPGIGALTVYTSDQGIAAVTFPRHADDHALTPWLAAGARIVSERTAFHDRFAAELAALSAGKSARMRSPHDHRFVPPFLSTVLTTLRTVPAGKTVSYGELAALSGSPRAARAVGTAMARNPTPVLVPCHRVLASNGIGGFSPGVELKRKLLAIEAVYLPTRR